MANMNVTYDEMRSAASNLQSGQQEIKGNLDKLQKLIKDLISSGYVTDKSSQAFDASYEEFDKGANQAIEGLHGMSDYLSKAAQALEDTDSQLASQLNK